MSKKRETLSPLVAQLYDAAEVALDDTDNFYSNWLDAGRQQLKIFDDYLGSVRAGTDAVAKKTIELAASNSTRASHFARKLMRAKDANEIFAVQLEFYQQLSLFAQEDRVSSS
jgi:hypothetical protein